MFSLPKLRRIHQTAALRTYGQAYAASSGLPVPEDYLLAPENHCYGLYYQRQLIGGFILGNTATYRTIAVFARPEQQADVRRQLTDSTTEICCFFIQREFRTHTPLNFVVWLSLLYCLLRHGRREILFGTCSASLARLYAQTRWSEPIHTDRVDGRNTYIFRARRGKAMAGFVKILGHKLRRVRRISGRNTRMISA